MKVVSLTDSTDTNDAAFCGKKMDAARVSGDRLCAALYAAFSPFVPFLKDGYGVGIYLSGERGVVIGFTAPQESEDV